MATYNRYDFRHNWAEINKNLAERWNEVLRKNPHNNLKKRTLTDKFWVDSITKALDKWLPKTKGLKILKYDLYNEATSTAALSLWFLKRGYKFYGIDIAKEIVELAKKNYCEIHDTENQFRVGDIRELPFKDDFFDIVFSYGTIEHIREQEKAVKEAYRVLKPNGIFITGVNNKLDMWFSFLVNEIANWTFKYITSYEASFFPWEQRRWVQKAGFKDIKISGMISFPHLIRYLDLYIEYKRARRVWRNVWDGLIVMPLIQFAKLLDTMDLFRFTRMHTTVIARKQR